MRTMYITKFQVLNFKSYRDSNEIKLKLGFNIITGQNSAGKTALLEAMALQAKDSPHRSLRTVPIRGGAPPHESVFRVTFSLTRDELFGFLGDQFHLGPQPQPGFPIPGNSPYQFRVNEAEFVKWLFNEPEYSVALQLRKWGNGSEDWTTEGPPLVQYPTAPPRCRRLLGDVDGPIDCRPRS
jgi:hypothetical protein